jgi:sodium/bile acid cotransporter 3/5
MNTIFIVVMTVFITINTFMMGTQLNIYIIFKVVRKPIGPVIGMFCQYLIMPAVGAAYSCSIIISRFQCAYVLARLFLDGHPDLQFGFFAYGCSPGGGNSNFWTILLDGNLDVSVTMTFFSSIAALCRCSLLSIPHWCSHDAIMAVHGRRDLLRRLRASFALVQYSRVSVQSAHTRRIGHVVG